MNQLRQQLRQLQLSGRSLATYLLAGLVMLIIAGLFVILFALRSGQINVGQAGAETAIAQRIQGTAIADGLTRTAVAAAATPTPPIPILTGLQIQVQAQEAQGQPPLPPQALVTLSFSPRLNEVNAFVVELLLRQSGRLLFSTTVRPPLTGLVILPLAGIDGSEQPVVRVTALAADGRALDRLEQPFAYAPAPGEAPTETPAFAPTDTPGGVVELGVSAYPVDFIDGSQQIFVEIRAEPPGTTSFAVQLIDATSGALLDSRIVPAPFADRVRFPVDASTPRAVLIVAQALSSAGQILAEQRIPVQLRSDFLERTATPTETPPFAIDLPDALALTATALAQQGRQPGDLAATLTAQSISTTSTTSAVGIDTLQSIDVPGTPPPTLTADVAATRIALDIGATQTLSAAAAQATDFAATLGAQLAQATFTPTLTPPPWLMPLGPTAVAGMITAPFAVIDLSGQVVGSGEARVFAPRAMSVDETSNVVVRIQVNELAPPLSGTISPTRTLVPPPSPTPRLDTPQPTFTPLPQVGLQFVEVREIMGAELRGVDIDKFDVDAVPPVGPRLINAQAVNEWKWNIKPKGSETVGLRDLVVYIYRPARRVDTGEPYNQTVNELPFRINVTSPAFGQNLTTLLEAALVGLGAILLLVAGAHYIQRRNMRAVFISYRRAQSAQLAQTLALKLERYGIDAFFDTREVSAAGHFPDRLQREIEENDVFICLLAGDTLESDWVRREIEYAHQLNKPTIPVFQESYQPPSQPISPAIESLLMSEGIKVLDVQNVYIDDAVKKLAQMIQKTPRQEDRPDKPDKPDAAGKPA